jgi:hypothetical protein
LLAVFKSADTHGMPNGVLDHTELEFRLSELRVGARPRQTSIFLLL